MGILFSFTYPVQQSQARRQSGATIAYILGLNQGRNSPLTPLSTLIRKEVPCTPQKNTV